jgi:hypothetical protein
MAERNPQRFEEIFRRNRFPGLNSKVLDLVRRIVKATPNSGI